MPTKQHPSISARIEHMRTLTTQDQGSAEYFEAASLAQSVLYDTIGGGHPIMGAINSALNASDWERAVAASKTVIDMYDHDALGSPRLELAHEIEGDLLEIAQAQVTVAETNHDSNQKQVQLAVAAFLAGASLEDALRRLCDARGLSYDSQRTSISKLQSVLFQPSNQIEVISSSENKRITAWGDTRNKADHGRFSDITHSEVLAMVVGVRGFIDSHLP